MHTYLIFIFLFLPKVIALSSTPPNVFLYSTVWSLPDGHSSLSFIRKVKSLLVTDILMVVSFSMTILSL